MAAPTRQRRGAGPADRRPRPDRRAHRPPGRRARRDAAPPRRRRPRHRQGPDRRPRRRRERRRRAGRGCGRGCSPTTRTRPASTSRISSMWLRRVYLRYADAALPSCWLWHPDVVEELWWLRQAHAEAFHPQTGSWRAVGDWHDRQRPNLVRRLRPLVNKCELSLHVPGSRTAAGPSADRAARGPRRRGRASPGPRPRAARSRRRTLCSSWTPSGSPARRCGAGDDRPATGRGGAAVRGRRVRAPALRARLLPGPPRAVAPSRRPAGRRPDRRPPAQRRQLLGRSGSGCASERGPASGRRCAGCAAPAACWSYDGTDPDERTDPARGYRYSLDLDRYQPRCRSCHRRADPRPRRAPHTGPRRRHRAGRAALPRRSQRHRHRRPPRGQPHRRPHRPPPPRRPTPTPRTAATHQPPRSRPQEHPDDHPGLQRSLNPTSTTRSTSRRTITDRVRRSDIEATSEGQPELPSKRQKPSTDTDHNDSDERTCTPRHRDPMGRRARLARAGGRDRLRLPGNINNSRGSAGGGVVLSIATGHDTRYLTEAVAEGRESYYTGAVAAGEPPGRWFGAGAERLGLAGTVDADLMESIYTHLRDPRDPAAHDPATRDDAEALAPEHRRYRSAEEIYAGLLESNPEAGTGAAGRAARPGRALRPAGRVVPGRHVLRAEERHRARGRVRARRRRRPRRRRRGHRRGVGRARRARSRRR